MPQLCLAVASLALSTSRPVCVVLLANRLSLVLPYLKWYHTLLSSAVVSKYKVPTPQAGLHQSSCTSSREIVQVGMISVHAIADPGIIREEETMRLLSGLALV